MKSKYIVKIRKFTQTEMLTAVLVTMPFLFSFLNGVLRLPWSVRYLMDAAWCLLLVYRCFAPRRGMQGLEIWVLLFFLYTLLSYLPQWQSPLYWLWGMRNNFRFYSAFFAFALFLKLKNIEGYLKLINNLFWLNAVVSLYQFFVMKLEGDYLGGLFGAEKGGNGYTNIYFLIMVTMSVTLYLEKREKTGQCLAKCVTALIIAALAELKFFFAEFAAVVAMAVLFTNFSWRKLVVILGAIAGISGSVAVLNIIFSKNTTWLTLQWFFDYATNDRGYTSTGDLNRLNAIAQINELWLQTGWQQLFGLGLGNCDTAGYSFLNTPFYESYSRLHYNWFSYVMMYLETGWMGLVFYWGFFVLVFFTVLRIERRSEAAVKTYCRIARILAVMCVAISIYNNSLRTEAGYMAYFVLAIPFALARETRKMKKHG